MLLCGAETAISCFINGDNSCGHQKRGRAESGPTRVVWFALSGPEFDSWVSLVWAEPHRNAAESKDNIRSVEDQHTRSDCLYLSYVTSGRM